MLCNFYFDPILRNLQGDTHKEHKFDMILKCHILNSFNMKCVTTDRLKTAILEFLVLGLGKKKSQLQKTKEDLLFQSYSAHA